MLIAMCNQYLSLTRLCVPGMHIDLSTPFLMLYIDQVMQDRSTGARINASRPSTTQVVYRGRLAGQTGYTPSGLSWYHVKITVSHSRSFATHVRWDWPTTPLREINRGLQRPDPTDCCRPQGAAEKCRNERQTDQRRLKGEARILGRNDPTDRL